jgi:PPM family protein phosphatase
MLGVVEQAFRSDTGRQRTANEDSYYASPPLFAVADGMGGAQAGEVASRIAAESFEPSKRVDEAPEAYLREIANAANERIHNLAQQDSSRSGMGTTLTAAMVEGDEVSFAHVGDSRAYVFRDGELRRLTSDHSLVEELRRQGRLTDEQAQDHPQRSIITRALGPEAEVDVDTLTVSARPGDVFLLCSDGLTTMVKEAEIGAALSESRGLDEAVTRMVREANDAGGRDNITAVAFRLEEAEEPAEEAATLIGPSAEDAGLTAERVRAAGAERAGRGQRGGPPRRRRVRTAAKVLIALVLVAAIAAGAWFGSRQVYFLGIDGTGQVALYRGLPYVLPFDLELYSEVEAAGVAADRLPTDRRDEATDHELRSHDDAVSLLGDLDASAVTPLPQPPTGATAGTEQGGDGARTAGNQSGDSAGGAGGGDGPRGQGGSDSGD